MRILISQLEEKGTEYQVSMVVALSTCANAASQTRRVAQNSYGSIATEMECPRHVRFTPASDPTADIVGQSQMCQERT